MKNKWKKILVTATAFTLIMGSSLVFSEPGSSKDPLISKSYVDEKIEEVKDYIDKKLKSGTENVGSSNHGNLEIVELKAGESILGSAGTEIILRSGNAVAIGSDLGGVSDITGGLDLTSGQKVKTNHLLIVPRADGRGVYSKGQTFFMVRGNYSIQ